jgi:hypothetical protein
MVVDFTTMANEEAFRYSQLRPPIKAWLAAAQRSGYGTSRQAPDGSYRIIPTVGRAWLARCRPSYTEADSRPNAIGADPCVTDPVRCVGNSDLRSRAPFASDVNHLCKHRV